MSRPRRSPRSGAPKTSRQTRASQEVLLEAHDIQGNILTGFNKDRQLLIALRLRDLTAARAWLARIVPHIHSVADVGPFNTLFSAQRRRLGHDPIGLVATWANIAFSHAGLAALTSRADADGVPDEAFRVGLPERASGLGDQAPDGSDDPTKDWVIGGTDCVPDVLLIVASDDE